MVTALLIAGAMLLLLKGQSPVVQAPLSKPKPAPDTVTSELDKGIKATESLVPLFGLMMSAGVSLTFAAVIVVAAAVIAANVYVGYHIVDMVIHSGEQGEQSYNRQWSAIVATMQAAVQKAGLTGNQGVIIGYPYADGYCREIVKRGMMQLELGSSINNTYRALMANSDKHSTDAQYLALLNSEIHVPPTRPGFPNPQLEARIANLALFVDWGRVAANIDAFHMWCARPRFPYTQEGWVIEGLTRQAFVGVNACSGSLSTEAVNADGQIAKTVIPFSGKA